MKKAGMILNAGLIAALLSSCTKTYTCECKYNSNAGPLAGETYTKFSYKAKSKDKDAPCKEVEANALDNNAGGNDIVNCTVQ